MREGEEPGGKDGSTALASARADWRVRSIAAGAGPDGPVGDCCVCSNCGRAGIPAANFEMHLATCQRTNWRCDHCDQVMPTCEKQAHLDSVLSVDAAFTAAKDGDVQALQVFLEHGGDKDAANSLSDRLLHVAVRCGKIAVTKLLLVNKADTCLSWTRRK